MGPRPIGRGNDGQLMEGWSDPGASMGPRPIGRGNDGTGYIFPRYEELQWGHVQSDVETA